MDIIRQPWPWYVAGAIVGLTVPALLLLGNKHFGISANLRHACAACLPANIKFFKYDWKKEVWNLFFVAGIFIGGFIAFQLLSDPQPVQVNPALVAELKGYGINDYNNLKRAFPAVNAYTLYMKAFNHKVVTILLTIFSTVIGLVPFVLGAQREVFWFVFATGTMGGLLFSFVGVYFFLPVFLLMGKE